MEATQFGRQESAKQTAEAKTFLTEKGMVLSGAPKDEEKWQAAAQAIWPEFYKDVGGEEWAKQAIEIVNKAKKGS